MTEIQALIDKLETEKAIELKKVADDLYHERPVFIYDHHAIARRVDNIDNIIAELKKHLPKENENADCFSLDEKYTNNGDQMFGYPNSSSYNFRIHCKNGKEITFWATFDQLPTVIEALQKAYKEREDD